MFGTFANSAPIQKVLPKRGDRVWFEQSLRVMAESGFQKFSDLNWQVVTRVASQLPGEWVALLEIFGISCDDYQKAAEEYSRSLPSRRERILDGARAALVFGLLAGAQLYYETQTFKPEIQQRIATELKEHGLENGSWKPLEDLTQAVIRHREFPQTWSLGNPGFSFVLDSWSENEGRYSAVYLVEGEASFDRLSINIDSFLWQLRSASFEFKSANRRGFLVSSQAN